MQAVIIILTVIIAILLIIVVLVQKSKGGGLASNFSGSNQIMGVRRTNDFIEKTTWVLACAVAILSIISVFVAPSKNFDAGVNLGTAPGEDTGTQYEQPAAVNEVPVSVTEMATPGQGDLVPVEMPAQETANQ